MPTGAGTSSAAASWPTEEDADVPRIAGPSIAEHVAAQEAAVVAAARRLFAERGVAAVSLGDIAAEVGLRRTSLYRYFPTKAHILQRWFDLEMDPLIERSHEVVDRPGPAGRRLEAWVDLQLDFVSDESHVALAEIGAMPDTLPEDVRDHVERRHRDLYAVLDGILREGDARTAAERRVRLRLIAGLIGSAAGLIGSGASRPVVRRELRRAAAAVAGI